MSFPNRSYDPKLPPLRPKREFSGWTWFVIILAIGLGLAALGIGIVAIGSSLGEAWRGAVT